MTKKEKGKGIAMEEEPQDFISGLPDEVSCSILSLLPIDEVVRTSILSKRWKSLWKQISHLDFDVKHMINPLQTRGYIQPKARSDFISSIPKEIGIYRYSILFFLIMKQHLGELTSCRFLHFPQDSVKCWIWLLLERKKGLKDLTMECERGPNGTTSDQSFCLASNEWGLFSSLESLEIIRYCFNGQPSVVVTKNLKTLKLKEIHMEDVIIDAILKSCVSLQNFTLHMSCGFSKLSVQSLSLKFLELYYIILNELEISAPSLEILVLATIICPVKNVSLYAPSLREFHCNRTRPKSMLIPYDFLKSHELLEGLGLLEYDNGKFFQNLSSLTVEFDLNNVRESFSLSYILRMSINLKTLKIILPAKNHRNLKTSTVAADASPHPCSTVWEGREICTCVRDNLKFVRIEGFTGRDMEVDFIKYLIETSTKMKMITVIYDISVDREDNWDIKVEKVASTNLRVNLERVKFTERVKS